MKGFGSKEKTSEKVLWKRNNEEAVIRGKWSFVQCCKQKGYIAYMFPAVLLTANF